METKEIATSSSEGSALHKDYFEAARNGDINEVKKWIERSSTGAVKEVDDNG